MGLVAPDAFEAAAALTAEADLDAAIALAEDAGSGVPLGGRRRFRKRGHAVSSASCLMPVMVAVMFVSHSCRRRAMIRSSLSGICSITLVVPDGPGPIWAQYRSRV